ncbi:hypothetical protein P3102_10295 [Amycolatopsis sp. QT-25]|uniref:hypothetical protein n=1 Tax=Amycolatopsis sp. QT-25 TaxID=3034022 RepID=UPI0023EB960B|nr:hypothetical protein [Amycolatopsis sp. QT-25]WET81570.1 hypothetical protein P3102_10295 [Amycolatopsis sp. QT-25]
MFRRHDAAFAVAKTQHLRGDLLFTANRLAEAAGKPAEARAHRVHALAECARYETPLARKMGHELAAGLGVAMPESA